jgi:hypothetical protein
MDRFKIDKQLFGILRETRGKEEEKKRRPFHAF